MILHSCLWNHIKYLITNSRSWNNSSILNWFLYIWQGIFWWGFFKGHFLFWTKWGRKVMVTWRNVQCQSGLITSVLDPPLVSVWAAGIPRAAALTIAEPAPLQELTESAPDPAPLHMQGKAALAGTSCILGLIYVSHTRPPLASFSPPHAVFVK